MQKLFEFYEMASLNAAALGDQERLAILKARRALRKFASAMDGFNRNVAEPGFNPDVNLRLAAWAGPGELPSR